MKKNQQQGISFDKVILEQVNFETDPDYQLGDRPLSVKTKLTPKKKLFDNKTKLKLTLNIEIEFIDTKNTPMKINVSAAGYFSVKDISNVDILEEFSEIQAPAMLFPFIREIVSNLTMRTDYEPLVLPPVNFLALIGQKKTKKNKTPTTPK
jgi:preprotein translocase subunit SecB